MARMQEISQRLSRFGAGPSAFTGAVADGLLPPEA